LQRLVGRGVRAEDEEWIGLWNQFCKQCRIQPDIFLGIPKGPLTEFVERNMLLLRKKEWAKDLLFKAEGQSDELIDSQSDGEDEQSATAATGTRSAAAAATERPPAAGAPPRAKTPVEQPGGNRPRATRPREPAPPAPGLESSCSSGSESSPSPEVQQQRKRRKTNEKKKHGMLGYGDYFGRGQKDLHISPEAMMMNQYMGSMMMMNNPLYAAGMMPGMMPGMMGMVAPGAIMNPTPAQARARKQNDEALLLEGMKPPRKDEKTKKLKVDTKLKRDTRERDRERDRQPMRNEKEPALQDPRLNKAKPAVKPTPPNAAKDAMIDAADL